MPLSKVSSLPLPGGEQVPVLGIGTWKMAEHAGTRSSEIAALRAAVDLGMTVIDTAEMYGSGRSETLIGEALGDRRSDTFLVSKVLPQNATTAGTVTACEASLKRLGTDRLDLYLLHWRGPVPLEATLAGFETLLRAGKIRYWGVSNFDVEDMQELEALAPPAGTGAATNQVLYNLSRRGIEHDLLPWCQSRGIPIMAYSPLEQGDLASQATLAAIARRHNCTAAQIALRWVLRQSGVMAIPKAGSVEHVRENHAALRIELSSKDVAELDTAFRPPRRKVPLEMI